MLNKYRILLYIVICLITTNIIAQTKNYQWLLVDALAKDDFFKACEYKNVCGDTIAKSLDIFYQYKMYGYLNKPDSSAICLEKVLKEYPDFFSAPLTKFAYLNILIELWQNCENYEKLLEAYNMAEHLISTINAEENWAYQQFAILKQLKVEAQKKMRLPKISVKNISKNKKATIDFIETPVVTTNIKLNGISCKTWIDTGGAGYLLMTKEMADRCNAKELISGIDSLDVNGKRIRGAHAWVDSIQIGSTIVTRVPAIVVYGDFSSFVPIDMLTEKEQNEYKSVMNTVGIIVGLPLLQKLGSIEFDWDKKVLNMTLTPEDSGGQKANMFTLNNQLYICLDVNTTEFVGMVDIGAAHTYIELNRHFVEKNRDKFPISNMQEEEQIYQKSIGVIIPSKRKSILNAKVFWESRSIQSQRYYCFRK